MRLLENVRGAKSSAQTIATVMALNKTIDKVTVLAGNCNGFIGNRMFQFYNNGWEYLLEEGAMPEQIDRVAQEFGFPMGPLAVRDLAGLDVAALVRAARAPLLPKGGAYLADPRTAGSHGTRRPEERRGLLPIRGPETELRSGGDESHRAGGSGCGRKRRKVADEEIMPRMLYPLVNEGRKSSKRASRYAPATSMWPIAMATAFRNISAARCTGPSDRASSGSSP